MRAKLQAVRIAASCGVTVQISSGFVPSPIEHALEHHGGTTVLAQRAVPLRKGWIGHSSGYRGVIVINQGARQALLLSGSSLLPVGITEIRGEFARFEVVQIEDDAGNLIGRGLASFSADDLKRFRGLKSSEILKLPGVPNSLTPGNTEAIHRDNLVLFEGERDEQL